MLPSLTRARYRNGTFRYLCALEHDERKEKPTVLGRKSETTAFREVITTTQHAGNNGASWTQCIEHRESAKLTFGQQDSVLRLEAARHFERAAFHSSDDHDRRSTANGRPYSSSDPVNGLPHLPKLYGSNASSSMTPMERFALLSPASDPCPWESKRVMAALELREGSLETVKTRSDAAIVVAASGGKDLSISVVATTGSVR